MQYFRHEFARIEDYLHHRDPYLLVEKIISITPTEVVTARSVSGQEFFLQGHFPGASIFPGAMMQELTTQTAGILIASQYNPMADYNTEDPHFNEFALGVLVKVRQAKYKGFARPGDTLIVKATLVEQVGNLFEFTATITVASKTVMRNRFALANIKSKELIGN